MINRLLYNQQGPTVEHMEFCSVLCGSLDGRGVWGRMNTCICMAESLCCPRETITTLLISYTPICVLITQSCQILCYPMDYSLPGSSVHGILQARILEWVACPPPRDLPDPGIELASLTSPALAGGPFTASATWEAQTSIIGGIINNVRVDLSRSQ